MKLFFGRRRQVHQPRVSPALIRGTGPPRHHVRVDVHRIHRVDDGHHVVLAEDFKNVARIALRAVRHEHFVKVDRHPARREVVVDDRLPEEIVALLGAVAAECRANTQLVGRLVDGGDHGGRERLGDIADPHADNLGGRVLAGELADAARDLRKQISRFEFAVVFR